MIAIFINKLREFLSNIWSVLIIVDNIAG